MNGYANEDDVLAQLRSAGLIVDPPLKLANGAKSERCHVEGGDREKRGWYRLHEWVLDSGERMLVGSYGVFHGDDPNTQKVELTKRCEQCGREIALKDKVCSGCGSKTFKKREPTPEQKAALRESANQDRKRAEAERNQDIRRASQWAGEVWRNSREIEPGEHDYLVKKKLTGTGGVRVFESNDGLQLVDAEPDDFRYLAKFHGALVVPMQDPVGRIFGLQFILSRERHRERIARTGRDKEYWPAGLSKDGRYFLIGPSPSRVILIAEGFATAMSLHAASGQSVAVAFDAGNLPKVAKVLKGAYRRVRPLICADDDWLQKCMACGAYTPVATELCAHCDQPHKKANAGVQRAQEAALIAEGHWVAPKFSAARPSDRKGPTDFNDLHVAEGLPTVRGQIEQALLSMGLPPSPAAQSDRDAGGDDSGGRGSKLRKAAQAVMSLDDAIERFVPLDDGTGDYLFDTWTNKVVKKGQMLAVLPAGVRAEEVKRHPQWVTRGACYLDQVGFDPSEKDENVKLNTWRGWPMKPMRGSCEHLLELLYFLCSHETNGEEVYDWLLNWLAYPLQNPGAKMASAVIMHGPQGTGKSTFFQVIAKIYGPYATVLNQRGLEDKFNSDWSDSKLFILAEEVVTRAEMWHIKNELKELVTGEWIRVNPKNLAAYLQRNHLNIVFLSNENQPLPLDNDDRRHLVIYTPPALSEAFYDAVNIEIEQGGIAALYDYLLSRDLRGWHPKKRPPMTESKQKLITLSQTSELRFVSDWVSGDFGLPVCPCLSADLYQAYLRWCRLNGESRPRPSNQFVGAVEHMTGWEKRKARYYPSEGSTSTENKQVVFPPENVLQAHGSQRPDHQSHPVWLGHQVRKFADALANLRGGL